MSQDWLTVEVVGELQECVEDGRDIEPLVSALRNATLPGFVEYRCLGRAMKGLVPPLPPAISSSTIGRAFDALRPKASSGAASPSLRIDRLPAEFHLLRSEGDLEDDRWKTFTIRFARSAQGVGLDRTIAGGLRAALLEMAENTILHSESDGPSLVGYRVLDGFAQFCVADVGVGVLRSLRTNPEYSHLRYDHEALRQALRDGVSRFGKNRGGMGFREMFKALSAQGGGSGSAAARGASHWPAWTSPPTGSTRISSCRSPDCRSRSPAVPGNPPRKSPSSDDSQRRSLTWTRESPIISLDLVRLTRE